MNRPQDIDEAVRFLKRTLPLMGKHDIPTTPHNYAVWYEYSTGTRTDLKADIDAIIEQGRPFTAELNESLYQRFIAHQENTAFLTIQDSVRRIIDQVTEHIGQETHDLKTYGESLQALSGELGQSKGKVDSLDTMLTNVIVQTGNREHAGQVLHSTLVDMASEIRQLRKQIEQLTLAATTDALTRIPNRRAFDIELDQAMVDSRAEDKPLCMLMIDIDHFKCFNDDHGHIVGDKVLRFVASQLKRMVRGQDIVARFGGEEFAVLLPNTAYSGGIAVADNLRRTIAANRLQDSSKNMSLGSVTVSVGVAEYRPGEDDFSLISRADQCLYLAKSEGRDRVKGERDLSTPPVQEA